MPVFSSSLPRYTGPHSVSTTDLEIAVPAQAFGTSLLLKDRTPALSFETILCTIYYPSVPPVPSHNPFSSPAHQNWLERPLSRTATGYSKFSGRSAWLLTPLLWLLASGTQLPAGVDRPLVESGLAAEGEKEMQQKSNTSSDDTLSESPSFPLIVFSHGLGGTRTTYSQYCGELASRGNIVVAPEHRDGSGPITVVHSKTGEEKTVLYLKPEDLTYDAPNEKLSSMDFRKEQLLQRQGEIIAIMDLVERINSGDGEAVTMENLRRGGGVDFASWRGRIDVKKSVMSGHSFGGATTLQVLRAGSVFPFAKGICLDPWVDPIPPYSSAPSSAAASTTSGTEIHVPLLVINSENFTLWPQHFTEVKKVVVAVSKSAEAWLITLVGSVHLSFSDFPIIQPYIASKTGARVDPKLAISEYVEASVEFLSGEGRTGKILGRKVGEKDADGGREGEVGWGKEKVPMAGTPGEVRIHVSPVH